MVKLWLRYGLGMVKVWLRHGQGMVKVWLRHGQGMVKVWLRSLRNMGKMTDSTSLSLFLPRTQAFTLTSTSWPSGFSTFTCTD
jgi:hypothetical protein